MFGDLRSTPRGPQAVRSYLMTVLAAFLATLFGQSASAQSEEPSTESDRPTNAVLLTDGLPGSVPRPEVRVGRVPPGLSISRHVYSPGLGRGSPTGRLPFEDLAYSNTPPPAEYLDLPFASVEVADDITTIALAGCTALAYELLVHGGGDGTGPGFTATFQAYDDCPHGEGLPLEGTGGSITLEDDGLHQIMVDLSSAPVSIPRRFWIGVSFDRPGPGWVLGTPATIGYTENLYDFQFIPCNARLANSDVYAGFFARIYCEAPFDREFTAYRNMQLDQIAPASPGSGNWWADDVELIVDNCVLSSFELGVIGGQNFTLSSEIRSLCPPDSVVEGTQVVRQVVANYAPQIVRFDFPGGLALPAPQDSFWVAFRFNTGAANILMPGEASVGFTDDFFGVQEGDDCGLYNWNAPDNYSGYAITINCLGDEPTGACCEPGEPGGGLQCEQTRYTACVGPTARWQAGGDCSDPSTFDPPCGAHACCLPGPPPIGACQDQFADDCAAQGGFWLNDRLCDPDGQTCPVFECLGATGHCMVAHGGVGCTTEACCDDVCSFDPWCCTVEWDAVCVRWAEVFCGDPPPNDNCFDPDPSLGAMTVPANGAVAVSNRYATRNLNDPGFCCHPYAPNAALNYSLWYKFQATHTSARISTCGSLAPASDSRVAVYRARDPSTPESACATLEWLACNDDAAGCGEGENSDLCVTYLLSGETYFVQLTGDRGPYQLRIESPCPPDGPAPSCVAGAITWIDPPDGVVDARQPTRPDGTLPDGIREFHLEGPPSVLDRCCWHLCETGEAEEPNYIDLLAEHPDGGYQLTLERPITPGEVTAMTFHSTGQSASFTAHPANVNGDEVANPADILALIDHINGVRPAPWGTYSCNIDHNGDCIASDITRLIDLLNGAGAFDPWYDTPIPVNDGACTAQPRRESPQ